MFLPVGVAGTYFQTFVITSGAGTCCDIQVVSGVEMRNHEPYRLVTPENLRLWSL